MLVDKVYKIKINSRYIKHYESLGYVVPKKENNKGKEIYAIGEYMPIEVKDILQQSNIKVDVICDYCGEEYEISLDNRYKYYHKGIIKKDSCFKCATEKIKESTLKTHGVENVMYLDEFKEKLYETNWEKYGSKTASQNVDVQNKIKTTMMNKYGVDNPLKNDKIKEKTRNTCLERYGFVNPSMNREIYNKIKITNLERYGFETASSNEMVINKTKRTNLERYGFECCLQNEEIKNKSRQSLYKNNTAPCSKQQRYIYEIIGGELNYPVSNISLDIAFPDEKIYLEYDGGGHDLSVKIGRESKKEFNLKEIRRYQFLKSLGWKQIRMISESDYVLNKIDLIDFMYNSKNEILNNNKNHVTIILNKENCEYELIKI